MSTFRNGKEPCHARPRSGVFLRLARWSYRRRWWALLLWVAVLAVGTVAGQLAGNAYHNDFSLPGTESQRALDILRERAPAQTGATVDIVFQAPEALRHRARDHGSTGSSPTCDGYPEWPT
ncbi:hypothetical protein AAH979_40550 [Plantactinospora sp. ZYX-F-223]|uniref:hypothetical protein n=1 Tax=Plantactinospora sp. ZYX-F-223 TaxID=3144103 RepID=UPI0031FBFE3E